VYNKKQYILVDNKQYFDYVPYMSAYNDVRNRNRRLYVVPWTPPPVSITHRVVLTGQQTLPEGEDETGFGTAMVAFRIRHLYPSWRFAGFVDPYHFVHNYAIRQYLVGFDSAKFGKHRVWFNAQTIAPRFIKQDGYGRPFVAPRVRTLVELNPPGPFKAGLPWVSLGTRTVTEKPWVVPYGFGTPILRTFKIIIKPFPIGYNEYGMPRVKNRTPQVYPTMVDQTVIPKPWVSYYVRRVYPQSFVTAKVPTPIVLFRDRKVFVPGINQTAIPMPTVRQQYAEQIYDQTIWQYWPQDYEAGEVGIPNLGGNPFPVGWHSLKFGPDIQVRFMGIRPRWDRPDSLFRFGTPTLNPVQYIYQTNQPGDEGAQTKWAKPQFSPLTVWAQLFPPEVALKNHPPPVFHEVDRYSNPPYNDLPPWFGTPTVFTPHTEYLRHYHDPQYGQDVGPWFGVETRLDLKNRKLLPLSIKPTLFGFPTLNGPRKLFIKTIRSMEFGMPDVRVPDFATQWLVTAGGIDSFGSSEHLVENFIREIFPDGSDNTIYGDNTPMVYHKPRGPQPEGWDSSVFGDDTWLSHYIRYLDMEGFDSYTEGYTFGMFEERMRVTGGTGRPVVSGGDSLRMGFPTVHEVRRPQRIAPYMIPPPQYCHPHSVEET
jgi:hypothetical protein